MTRLRSTLIPNPTFTWPSTGRSDDNARSIGKRYLNSQEFGELPNVRCPAPALCSTPLPVSAGTHCPSIELAAARPRRPTLRQAVEPLADTSLAGRASSSSSSSQEQSPSASDLRMPRGGPTSLLPVVLTPQPLCRLAHTCLESAVSRDHLPSSCHKRVFGLLPDPVNQHLRGMWPRTTVAPQLPQGV